MTSFRTNLPVVVHRADGVMPQMTCFILLSDVTELDGPTKAVPIDKTRRLPLGVPAQRWASTSTTRWRSPAPPARS